VDECSHSCSLLCSFGIERKEADTKNGGFVKKVSQGGGPSVSTAEVKKK